MKLSKMPVYLEFKESSVHVLDGEHGAEFPLERKADGRLTDAAAELLRNGLRGFLSQHGGAGPRQAICAIPARGVTVRAISLPPGAIADPARFLAMQVEANFPLSPNELAWGYLQLPASGARETGNDFILAAVKKETIADYSALISSLGLSPLFTVAALARAMALTSETGLLEIGAQRSELITLDAKLAPALRVLNWGKAQVANSETLLRMLPASAGKIYISSAELPVDDLVRQLARTIPVERLPITGGLGVTAAIEGLRRAAETGRHLLFLGSTQETERKFVAPRQWKWAAAASVLLLLALLLRYADAFVFRSALSRRMAEITTYRNTLPKVERELGFLNFIKTNQPAYLDTIAVIASAAPPGSRLDQLSLARRGDLSLRGSMQDPQGPETFRSKLIASGFFSKVVVEEQVAIQNPRKVNFRISAILKPDPARPVLPPEKPGKTNAAPAARSNGAPRSIPPGETPRLAPRPNT